MSTSHCFSHYFWTIHTAKRLTSRLQCTDIQYVYKLTWNEEYFGKVTTNLIESPIWAFRFYNHSYPNKNVPLHSYVLWSRGLWWYKWKNCNFWVWFAFWAWFFCRFNCFKNDCTVFCLWSFDITRTRSNLMLYFQENWDIPNTVSAVRKKEMYIGTETDVSKTKAYLSKTKSSSQLFYHTRIQYTILFSKCKLKTMKKVVQFIQLWLFNVSTIHLLKINQNWGLTFGGSYCTLCATLYAKCNY